MPSLHGNVSLHPPLRQWGNFGLAPVYVLLNGMQTAVVPCPSGTSPDFSHAAGSFLSARFLAAVAFPCNVCALRRRLLELRLWPERSPLGQSQPILRLTELIREENVISAVLQGPGRDRKQREPAGQCHGCQSSARSATAPQFCCVTSGLHGCSMHTKTGLAPTRACLQQILHYPCDHLY